MATTEVVKNNIKQTRALNDIIRFEAYINRLTGDIKQIQKEAAERVEDLKAQLKDMRANVMAATWKKNSILDTLETRLMGNDMPESATITLDDFDVDGVTIDIELIRGEMDHERRKRHEKRKHETDQE